MSLSKGERIGICIAATAVLISGPWFYIQLLVWKSEGHDHMLTAANILVTVCLWATLGFCIRQWFREIKIAESRQAKIDNASAQQLAELQSRNKSLSADLKILQDKVASMEKYHQTNVELAIRQSAKLFQVKGFLLGPELDNIKTAGECDQLAWHATRLRQHLLAIFQQLQNEHNEKAIEALTYPLATQFPATDDQWKSYHRSVSNFQDGYGIIRNRTSMLSLKNFTAVVMQCGIGSSEPEAHYVKLARGLQEFSQLLTEESRRRMRAYRDSVESMFAD
jgi:hypothetical protein